MIYLQMHLHSKTLKKSVELNVLLPQNINGESYKTLWLLHGLTDDHTAWMRFSSIERYAEQAGIAVVMPNADRSWYTNTAYDAKYKTFITHELPDLLRSHFKGMSDKREDNIIGGLSMGGYGAVKLALLHPEKYGACISLSGSFDITRKNRPVNINEWRSIFGFETESPDELGGGEHDLFAIAERFAESGATTPKMYMWCGTEDHLIDLNHRFHEHLNTLGIDHKYEYSEGNHSWKWWDMHIQSGLNAVLNGEI